uniref:Ribonuclease A-domain domain-containing protein n=1 Tax=Oreochromis niloticus TaxID=8128 RepID=A0A669BLZ9_ORENI
MGNRIMQVQFVCLLLGLLSAVELCASLDFYQKHVIGNMLEYECATVMQTRQINGRNGGCKKINTFLLDTGVRVRNTCAHGDGTHNVGFNVVVTSSHPNCSYTGRRHDNRIVPIKCKHGVPVHLHSSKLVKLF